jgi:hypothetical protein
MDMEVEMRKMRVGMMWFDGDREHSLADRIERAADYYHTKYGARPTLCYMHPATGAQEATGGPRDLTVRTSREVLPDHFWLGVESGDELAVSR